MGPGLLGTEVAGLVGTELDPPWVVCVDLGLTGLSLPSLGLICSSNSTDGNDCEGGCNEVHSIHAEQISCNQMCTYPRVFGPASQSFGRDHPRRVRHGRQCRWRRLSTQQVELNVRVAALAWDPATRPLARRFYCHFRKVNEASEGWLTVNVLGAVFAVQRARGRWHAAETIRRLSVVLSLGHG